MGKNNQLEQIIGSIRQKYDVAFESMTVDSRTIDILAINNMRDHIDKIVKCKTVGNPLKKLPLWAKIWPGSFVLGRLLRKYQPEGKTMLELGAGCGILSIIASSYGFEKIVLTDNNQDAILFAKANVIKNECNQMIDVNYLDVTTPGKDTRFSKPFDIIAASELLYLEELHTPIINFIKRHLANNGKALFCTDMSRKKNHFNKKASKYFKILEGHIGVKTRDNDLSESADTRVYNITILEHI